MFEGFQRFRVSRAGWRWNITKKKNTMPVIWRKVRIKMSKIEECKKEDGYISISLGRAASLRKGEYSGYEMRIEGGGIARQSVAEYLAGNVNINLRVPTLDGAISDAMRLRGLVIDKVLHDSVGVLASEEEKADVAARVRFVGLLRAAYVDAAFAKARRERDEAAALLRDARSQLRDASERLEEADVFGVSGAARSALMQDVNAATCDVAELSDKFRDARDNVRNVEHEFAYAWRRWCGCDGKALHGVERVTKFASKRASDYAELCARAEEEAKCAAERAKAVAAAVAANNGEAEKIKNGVHY